MIDPLASHVVATIGPVAVSETVATTWAIMAAMVGSAAFLTRRLRPVPNRAQVLLEMAVEGLADQIEEIIGLPPRPYLPLLGTLFLFVLAANLSAVLPGTSAPTARIETTAALALIVFFSVHIFGIRARGLKGYAAHYLEPSPLLLPLTVLSELTRTAALMIRLAGNITSHELVIAIILTLAGLLLPVPLMALGMLIGAVQAYIFAVLATVFIGAGVGAVQTA